MIGVDSTHVRKAPARAICRFTQPQRIAMHTSKLVNQLQPSETLAAAAKARELRAKGIDVLELSLIHI